MHNVLESLGAALEDRARARRESDTRDLKMSRVPGCKTRMMTTRIFVHSVYDGPCDEDDGTYVIDHHSAFAQTSATSAPKLHSLCLSYGKLSSGPHGGRPTISHYHVLNQHHTNHTIR
jgi:hypothetical protein